MAKAFQVPLKLNFVPIHINYLAMYARDSSEVKNESAAASVSRKRSRFDEVGELGRDTRENEIKRSDSRTDSRSDNRDSRESKDRDYIRDSRDSRESRDKRDSRDRSIGYSRDDRDDRDRHRDSRSRDFDRHRDNRDSREESIDSRDTRTADRETHRDTRTDTSRPDERDDRVKRPRDDRDQGRDNEYDRYRRERGERYRDDRDNRGGRDNRNRYSNDRDRYDSRRSSSNAVEIPFDRFLRLSPWRGPVTPLEERMRHLKNWDVAPAGFERISADKAKLTGLFPPPGNIAKTSNYVPPTLDPARAAMFQLLNKDTASMPAASLTTTPAELSGNLLKQAKRFYIGNLPVNFTESALIKFLETNLQGLSGSSKSSSGESKVLNITVSTDRSYAFVECRTAEDASLAMNLDGVVYEGIQLKVRRPKEYHIAITTGQLGTASATAAVNQNTAASTNTIENSIINKRQLIISDIPDILTADHIKSLLILIADLRTFLLLKDRETGKSLGVAIFEFVEDLEGEEWSGPFLTHSKGNLFMGPFEMKIQRVCDLMADDSGDNDSAAGDAQSLRDLLSVYNLQPGYATAPSSTPILQLLNIVTRESLLLDYDAIHQDLHQELLKYSSTPSIELIIPKPMEGNLLVPGVGKVFVKFERIEDAAKAAGELAGRIFDGHTCIVSFYSPEKFEKRLF